MRSSKLIIQSEDPVLVKKAQDFAQSCGMECEVQNPVASGGFYPNLVSGTNPLTSSYNSNSNVVPFPTAQNSQSQVSKINELEAQAIEQAIHAYRGNLTEAAKALGIGRATLYRKVKLYSIDTSAARKKRAA